MRKKWKLYGLSVCVFCYLAGCGRLTKGEPAEMPAVPTENSEHWEAQTEMEREISEEAQQQEGRTAELKDIAGMVGMEDKDTAGLFGGGEENWSQGSPSRSAVQQAIILVQNSSKTPKPCGFRGFSFSDCLPCFGIV